jgi:hypothetical protein
MALASMSARFPSALASMTATAAAIAAITIVTADMHSATATIGGGVTAMTGAGAAMTIGIGVTATAGAGATMTIDATGVRR